MGKVRIIIEKCATRFRMELRRKLDTLPPKARLAVIAGMLVPFAAGCLHTTVASIAGFGERGGTMKMRHIEKPDLPVYNPQIEMFAHFKTKSSFHKTKRII